MKKKINGLFHEKWVWILIQVNNLKKLFSVVKYIFSCKINKLTHLVWNSQTFSQKHLGVTLDSNLKFEEHFDNVSKSQHKVNIILHKVSKTVGLLLKLQNLLHETTHITIDKVSIVPYPDYRIMMMYLELKTGIFLI